jgi:hypothetical protein
MDVTGSIGVVVGVPAPGLALEAEEGGGGGGGASLRGMGAAVGETGAIWTSLPERPATTAARAASLIALGDELVSDTVMRIESGRGSAVGGAVSGDWRRARPQTHRHEHSHLRARTHTDIGTTTPIYKGERLRTDRQTRAGRTEGMDGARTKDMRRL